MARQQPERPEARKRPPSDAPWAPALWEPADAAAFKALFRGEATPDQQKRALDWLLKKAAYTYDVSYRPSSDRDTAFAEGRRFVGLQVLKLLQAPLAALRKRRTGEPSEQPD